MRALVAGERVPVGGELVLAFDASLQSPIGVALIAVDAQRNACADFTPIDGTTREMRPGVQFGDVGRLVIKPGELPASVDRLILVAYHAGGAALRCPLSLTAGDAGFALDLTDRSDAAVILVEVYRHTSGWRMAANGQGYADGLIAVAASHRVDASWARRLSGSPSQGDRPPPPRSGSYSGSGVAIDRWHVLSNAHVVEDATKINVVAAGRTTGCELVFADPRNDLALLRVETELAGEAPFRPGLDLHLGEDIVVLGFPLTGLLGTGPQASAGNIAALCGIGNDSSIFQFTAPISSGNSGGPVLDMAGHIVGLVTSSLNMEHVRESGGNAQNINFGIKGAVIRSFLDAFGVVPRLAIDAAPVGRAQVVRQARDAIFRINSLC